MTATEGFSVNTPDLVDAVKRAAKVAPTKGSAFDAAQGVRFEIQDECLVVKASDLETNYRQTIPLINGSKSMMPFRLPSRVLAAYLGQLPTGEGSICEVTRELDSTRVKLSTETTKGEFGVITGDSFPLFTEFSDDLDFVSVEALSGRLAQVSWAAARDSQPLDGIHIDGEWLSATDKGAAARVACPIVLAGPITAPLTAVTGALSGHKGPVEMAASERLHLRPDPDVQISTTLYQADYPNVGKAIELMIADSTETKVHVGDFDAALSRILALCQGERYPTVDLAIRGAEIRMVAEIREVGRVEELIVMESDLPYELDIIFAPTRLKAALAALATSTALIGWPSNSLRPARFSDNSGFEAVVMPINRGKS